MRTINASIMKKRWTAKEENELRDLYLTMTSKDLADRFGTTEKAIYQKCFKLKLKKDPPNKINLSDRQVYWLKKNYPALQMKFAHQYSASV